MTSSILVYDDEESILEVIKIILEDNGFDVFVSVNSENILTDIETYSPGLILIDIWMKGQNGDEIVKQLKSSAKNRSIPVILISALNEGEKLAKAAGADGFMKKPFDMEDLLVRVKEYIKVGHAVS